MKQQLSAQLTILHRLLKSCRYKNPFAIKQKKQKNHEKNLPIAPKIKSSRLVCLIFLGRKCGNGKSASVLRSPNAMEQSSVSSFLLSPFFLFTTSLNQRAIHTATHTHTIAANEGPSVQLLYPPMGQDYLSKAGYHRFGPATSPHRLVGGTAFAKQGRPGWQKEELVLVG